MPKTYDEAVSALWAEAQDGKCDYDEGTRQYFLSNLHLLLPHLKWPDMVRIARQAAYNQERAILDLKYTTALLNGLTIDDPHNALRCDRPAIFVSAHLAGYRLAAPLLLRKGFPLTVVLDSSVASEQQDGFASVFSTVREELRAPEDHLKFRTTAEAGLLLGLMRDLRQGRSLLLYIDGNRGTSSSSENLLKMPFLNSTLRARTGIPIVAHMSGSPLVPIMMERTADPMRNVARVLPAIVSERESRDSYVKRALSSVWSEIATRVTHQPEEWEAMRYVHTYAELTRDKPPQSVDLLQPVEFNRCRFAIKSASGRSELLDRQNLTVISLTDPLRHILETLHSVDGSGSNTHRPMEVVALEWLASRGLIVNSEGCH